MAAFNTLSNLIQTIHDPPQTFVLLSEVSNYSWQLKLLLIASELRCYVSTKREEISRDRKLVAGDKEAAFKDWKTLANFIKGKIVAGDLHVTGWGSSHVELIIDPGRASSINIPLTELDSSDAAATTTDLIYMVANDARQHRHCALMPTATAASEPLQISPASAPRSVKSGKTQHGEPSQASQEDLSAAQKLVKAEAALAEKNAIIAEKNAILAEKDDVIARERAKPKAENIKVAAAPPKTVAGASTAMPGHARRVIKRAQFSDEDEDEDAPIGKGQGAATSKAKASSKKPESSSQPKSKQTKPPTEPPKRVVTRAEFDDDDEEDEVSPSVRGKSAAVATSQARGNATATSASQSRPKPKAAAPAKRVVKRAEFDDEEDEDEAAPVGKKRKT